MPLDQCRNEGNLFVITIHYETAGGMDLYRWKNTELNISKRTCVDISWDSIRVRIDRFPRYQIYAVFHTL